MLKPRTKRRLRTPEFRRRFDFYLRVTLPPLRGHTMTGSPLRMFRNAILILALIAVSQPTMARNHRPAQTPNGAAFNCLTCHTGGTGNANNVNVFGNAVRPFVSFPNSSLAAFWSPTLAAGDADGDGFSNGLELGDVDGDGILERNTGISNPGDAGSTPVIPNTSPAFTSTPITTAVKGIAYSYQATATDAEQQTIAFNKVSGPAWLNVSSGGLVSGTPPDNANAIEPVTIRALDSGGPPESADQTFIIAVTASFQGWQRLNFAAGENDPNAAPGSDGESDRIPNFIEYATRGNPTNADSFAFPLSFDGSQHATFAIDIRDDDPTLSVVAEIAGEARFGTPTTVNAVVSDPTPNDGLKRLTFTDAIANGSGVRRFFRLKFTNSQP